MVLKLEVYTLDGIYDDVVMTCDFDNREDYDEFDFKLTFGIQETLLGDALFAVYMEDGRWAYWPYPYEASVDMLDRLIQRKDFLGRKNLEVRGYDKAYGLDKKILLDNDENVERYELSAWQLRELIDIRDTYLNWMNYGR